MQRRTRKAILPIAMHHSAPQKSSLWANLWPNLLGHGLEYFDYSLYSVLAPVLALTFFGPSTPTLALLQAYGLFAAANIAKPLGAVVFGMIGDQWGRPLALKISMLGMIVPTFGMAFLPGYDTWGSWAVLGLIFLRLLQTFLMGGEGEGARLYLLEHMTANRACFANSLTWVLSMTGICCASLVAAWVMTTPPEAELWRYAYGVAGILSLSLLYIRRSFIPTPAFQREAMSPSLPFRQLWQDHKKAFGATILVCGAAGGLYHFYMIFWPTYLSDVLHIISEPRGAVHLSLGLWIYSLSAPLGGLLGDKIGAPRLMQIGTLAVLLCFAINGWCVSRGTFPLWCELLTAICIMAASIPGYVVLMNRFPVRLRYRGLALGHAVGSFLLSSSTPFVATALWKSTTEPLAPLLWSSLLALIVLGCALSLKRPPRPEHR